MEDPILEMSSVMQRAKMFELEPSSTPSSTPSSAPSDQRLVVNSGPGPVQAISTPATTITTADPSLPANVNETQFPPFDKYYYYMKSVQNPEAEIEFIEKTFTQLVGRKPVSLREDFCGTHANCCEWVKRDPSYIAYGVDIEPETIQYGRAQNQIHLTKEQKKRIHLRIADVLKNKGKADMDAICALNFSYFCFKERKVLKRYFKNAYTGLAKRGIFVLDCFGGANCCEPNEEETEYIDQRFSYFWDQKTYDAITNFAEFAIHFQRQGEPKRHDCFVYDWRMWSLSELTDILYEAGFQNVHHYWDVEQPGNEDLEYIKITSAPVMETWVSYIVAEKLEQ